jgi:hypothetical protein
LFCAFRDVVVAAEAGGGYFRADRFLLLTIKLTIMTTKFAVIGVVSMLGVGAAMHHARFCPLQKMMAAIHHQQATTVVVKAPAPVPAKTATSLAMASVAVK